MTITLTAQNWQTTLGGLLGGIPPIIIAAAMASSFTLTPRWYFILSIIGGLGTLLIGLAAKDSGTHSTMTQVQQSTLKATQKGGT